jgi:hypothetical protein
VRIVVVSSGESQATALAGFLLWMRDHRYDHVFVLADYEIESPTAVDSGLPDILRFVVFLGVQRGMVEVVEKKT